MGLHPQSARRVVMGAALAAVVSCVLVAVGVGVGTAEEPPVAESPVAESPVAESPVAESPVAASPVAEGPRLPVAAPTTEPTPEAVAPTTTPGAARSTVEPTETPEPTPEAETTEASSRASLPVRSAAAPEIVPGTPCTVTAKACADLGARQAWLIEDGAVRRGPVPVMIGDEIDPTPVGTFAVEWKAEAWTSREYLTQMPYSVFFAEGGIAFHEGNQQTPSAGCIKLGNADAMAWFEYLQVGDEVQVR